MIVCKLAAITKYSILHSMRITIHRTYPERYGRQSSIAEIVDRSARVLRYTVTEWFLTSRALPRVFHANGAVYSRREKASIARARVCDCTWLAKSNPWLDFNLHHRSRENSTVTDFTAFSSHDSIGRIRKRPFIHSVIRENKLFAFWSWSIRHNNITHNNTRLIL